jgi:hypothetical protein
LKDPNEIFKKGSNISIDESKIENRYKTVQFSKSNNVKKPEIKKRKTINKGEEIEFIF